MKYLFFNDFYYVLKKYIKYYFLFLILMIAFPVFLKYVLEIDFKDSFILNLFYFNVGINYAEFSPLEFMIFILNIAFYSFFYLDMFSKDIEFGKEFVLLRINLFRWILCKILINLFYTIIFYIFEIVLLFIIYIFFGYKFQLYNFLMISFFGFCLRFLLQLINIIFLIAFKKYCFFLVILLYLSPWIVKLSAVENITSVLFIDVYTKNNIILSAIAILLIISLLLMIIYVLNKKLLCQFEGSM